MFLNQIKFFFIKNKIKKKITNVQTENQVGTVKKIGILIDETLFTKREALVKKLISAGFHGDAISILVFKDVIYKNEIIVKPNFSAKDMDWSGSFSNPEVNYFIDQKFDLLINYYQTDKLSLLQATNLSKANFKVGFANIDKRLNHFMIQTTPDNYDIFVTELSKYLKILKKS